MQINNHMVSNLILNEEANHGAKNASNNCSLARVVILEGIDNEEGKQSRVFRGFGFAYLQAYSIAENNTASY